MKINIISDIHATLDPTNGFNVLYSRPNEFTKEDCIRTIESLHAFAHSERPNKNITYTYSNAEKYLHRLAPTNHNEYLALVDDVYSKFKDYEALSMSLQQHLVAEVDGIDEWHHILREAGLWSIAYGLKLDLCDVVSWMKKCFSSFDPQKLDPADYLLIAGDLGIQSTEEEIFSDIKAKVAGKFKDVFYIAGNHSHWWRKISGWSEEKPINIDLSHDYFEKHIGDWLFLGCTLWSPIPENARWRIEHYMNDYRYIPNFNATKSNAQFEIQSAWLRNKVLSNPKMKIVIFTHHQPFAECIKDDIKHNDPWANDNVAEAYADLNDTLKDINIHGNVKIWCCGHTHMPFDENVHGIRVVRNPIGYSDFYLYGLGDSECDPKNWYNKVIDLGE